MINLQLKVPVPGAARGPPAIGTNPATEEIMMTDACSEKYGGVNKGKGLMSERLWR